MGTTTSTRGRNALRDTQQLGGRPVHKGVPVQGIRPLVSGTATGILCGYVPPSEICTHLYQGKFVAYDSVELDSGGLASKEKQQEALRNALAIASVLGRVLILPKVKCNGLAIPGQSFKIEPTIVHVLPFAWIMVTNRACNNQDWCDTTLLQGNFDAFEKTFQAEPGFREHSIIHHAGFQRYNRTQRIHIVANDGRKESGSVNVVPKDIHCGLTEQELKEAVAPYAEVPVLWFSSLYHRFKGPEPGTLKTRLQDQFASLTAVPYGECVWW